jgi:hypothetical protein
MLALDCDEGGPSRWDVQRVTDERATRPVLTLHAGLDLSRRRLDTCLLDGLGELVAETAPPRDADGLRGLAALQRVRAVIESMNGPRFVHGTLEEHGWSPMRRRSRGVAALACNTYKIHAPLLAELSWRDLVPAIWLQRRHSRQRDMTRTPDRGCSAGPARGVYVMTGREEDRTCRFVWAVWRCSAL